MPSANKSIKRSFFISFLAVFHCFLIHAQSPLSIGGTVLDEQGTPMAGATVFINGSTRIMPTGADGKFTFQNILPGSYQISVQMLGHYPAAETVSVIESPINIKIWLKVKSTVLREVVIGNGPNLDNYYKLFKRELLGESDNGLSCKLLNEDVVNLSVGRQYLTADADDFLIVINARLGYRIRYRLKSFQHTLGTNYSTIDGDAVFEDLWGTDAMKKEWAENRAETYKESMRRFLRAVYKGTVLQEGFVVHDLYPSPAYNPYGYLYIDQRPIGFDSLTRVVDNAFKSLHFKRQLYANYDPKAAESFLKDQGGPLRTISVKRAVTSTLMNMDNRPVLIDRAGNCINCNINLNGKWGLSRLGDQLPNDYEPNIPLK